MNLNQIIHDQEREFARHMHDQKYSRNDWYFDRFLAEPLPLQAFHIGIALIAMVCAGSLAYGIYHFIQGVGLKLVGQ